MKSTEVRKTIEKGNQLVRDIESLSRQIEILNTCRQIELSGPESASFTERYYSVNTDNYNNREQAELTFQVTEAANRFVGELIGLLSRERTALEHQLETLINEGK